ncbi:MAG: ZIP family metal transporter [Candidatus Krumholzibacteriia bacterium]
MNASQWSVVLVIVAAMATVLGGLVVALPSRLKDRQLPHLIAFGAGFMLAAAFLAMVPTSMGLIDNAPLWILVGYILAHLFEHTFTPHFHFGEETHTEHLIKPGVSTSAFVGLMLHAAFDGISISSGFMISTSLGFFISLAVILHKIPEGVTMASVMVASGRGARPAVNSTVALAGATILGSVVMLALGPYRGYALALSAGIATYVAATDLIPELNKLKERRFSFSAISGVVFFFLVELIMGRVGIS